MKKLFLSLLMLPLLAWGQVGNYPALVGQKGATQPANCAIGQLFFDTSKTAGSNIYGCTSANVWTAEGGGAASSIVVGNPVTGGGANRVLYEDGSQNLAANGSFLFSATGSVSGGPSLQVGAGTTTSSGWLLGYTNTLSLGTGSTLHSTAVGAASTSNYTLYSDATYTYLNSPSSIRFAVGNSVQALINNAGGLAITNASTTPVSYIGTAQGTSNAVVFHNASVATNSNAPATSRAEINKSVTGIADATPTATFTVTIPNAAHSGMLKTTLACSLGAGGAIGANEATATISYDFAITRVAGVNATVAASSAYGSAATAVAGADTVTVTAAASAVSGAVGATNTFTVNATVTKSGGSSANHTCLVYGRLMNANATGITIQ